MLLAVDWHSMKVLGKEPTTKAVQIKFTVRFRSNQTLIARLLQLPEKNENIKNYASERADENFLSRVFPQFSSSTSGKVVCRVQFRRRLSAINSASRTVRWSYLHWIKWKLWMWIIYELLRVFIRKKKPREKSFVALWRLGRAQDFKDNGRECSSTFFLRSVTNYSLWSGVISDGDERHS